MTLRLLPALLVAALLAGCGGGHASGYDHDGLALAYPHTWTVDHPDDRGMVLNVHSPPRRDRLYTRVTLFRQRNEFASLAQYGAVLRDDRSITVGGAGPARLGDATLADGTRVKRVVKDTDVRFRDGRRVPYVLRETLALHGPEQFRLTIFAPADDVGSPAVRRIERSLKLPG